MPKNPTDYSRTVIYKIQHIYDDSLLYLGGTTFFTGRKCSHKTTSTNEKSPSYNFKLYRMIRDNGGWDKFSMVIVKEFPCANKRESEMEEDRIMREMKATMNSMSSYASDSAKIERNKKWKSQYYITNKAEINIKSHLYNIKNKETLKASKKIYHDKNKEAILQKQREFYQKTKIAQLANRKVYYEANKEKILARVSQKTTCECGCVTTNQHLSRHKKSKKHIALMELIL
jgi:hypothetical protein